MNGNVTKTRHVNVFKTDSLKSICPNLYVRSDNITTTTILEAELLIKPNLFLHGPELPRPGWPSLTIDLVWFIVFYDFMSKL